MTLCSEFNQTTKKAKKIQLISATGSQLISTGSSEEKVREVTRCQRPFLYQKSQEAPHVD